MTTNGLFASDGIDVQALVAEHLGPRVLPCELIRPGAVGARDTNNLTLAPVPGAPTVYKCRGFIEDFSSISIDGALIVAGDRKVTLLAGTLATEPQPGLGKDRVKVENKTWAVHRIISRDPAAATYVLQVRDPAPEA